MYKICQEEQRGVYNGIYFPLVDGNAQYEDYKEWVKEGNTPEYLEPKPGPDSGVYGDEQATARLKARVQARLDGFARTRAYDGILSACTYASSANAAYALEGQYCVEARDATWDAAFTAISAVMAPGDGQDSYTESELNALWKQIEQRLPMLIWPENIGAYND